MPPADSASERTLKTLHDYLAPHRHSALLAAIVAAFTARPLIGDTGAGFMVFSVVLVLLLLVALYNINIDELVGERERLLAQSRRRRILGWTLAALAGLERVSVMFVQSPALNLTSAICWFFFAAFVTMSELRSVLKQREVTGETICMAVSVYLMIGFTWALLYSIMFQLNPGSFGGLGSPTLAHGAEIVHIFPVLGYFSLTTLSTVGFGDITPITLQARYAAVAEGITGQFYLAILVARLVGLQMGGSAGQQHSA